MSLEVELCIEPPKREEKKQGVTVTQPRRVLPGTRTWKQNRVKCLRRKQSSYPNKRHVGFMKMYADPHSNYSRALWFWEKALNCTL